MEELKYAQYQQRLDILKEKTKQLLQATGNTDLIDRLYSELNATNERQVLKLAFVGQYSSGKSTIISALTGNRNIKIDANIATDKVTEYEWNNIVLMDTPGILAGKVEDHDLRTKEALKECDLIFYVLTSQLFDDVVFRNFIELAYAQHLADKIFIVINKMGMEDGTFDELVCNYTASLENTFAEKGYDFSSFPVAFIDANDYIEGTEEQDEDFVQLSNFEHFIDMLNSFVSSKGIIKKQFDTPVRILQSYVKDISVSEVDENLANFYRQFEQKLLISQNEIKRDVSNVLYSFVSDAMSKVINLSSQIGDIDENKWKVEQKLLDDNLKALIADTSTSIENTINQNYEVLVNEINGFCSKDSLNNYYQDLETKFNASNITIEEKKSIEGQMKALGWLKKGAQGIGNMAPNVSDFFGGISQASGSSLHNIVLNVGHFFGKSFKPWQAVRWASNIAKVAKFGIPVVTAGIDIWMQIHDERKENRRREQIKDSKNQFVTEYQTQVNSIKSQFEQYLNGVMENFNNKRNEINQSKDEIAKMTKRNSQLNKAIAELEGEYVDFIEVIDGENS